MTIVAVSFTSESADRYLSLFTDVAGPEDLVSRLQEEYGEEFGYLRIDAYATDNLSEENTLLSALKDALYKAQEAIYDIG